MLKARSLQHDDIAMLKSQYRLLYNLTIEPLKIILMDKGGMFSTDQLHTWQAGTRVTWHS